MATITLKSGVLSRGLYKKWQESATPEQLRFVDTALKMLEDNYAAGGHWVLETHEPADLLQLGSLEAIKELCGLRVEQNLNARPGEDSDPQLEEARAYSRWVDEHFPGPACLECGWRPGNPKGHNCPDVITGTFEESGLIFGYKSWCVDTSYGPERILVVYRDSDEVWRSQETMSVANLIADARTELKAMAEDEAAKKLWAQVQALRAENARLAAR